MTATTDGWEPEKIIDLYAQVVKDVDAVGAGWIKVTRANGRLQFERVRGSYAYLFDGEVDLLEDVVKKIGRLKDIDADEDRVKALAIIAHKLRRGNT